MARISVLDEDVSLDEPTLVEGFPGVGLVGKIATDHMIEEHEMVHYANVHCDGLPRVAVYREDERALTTPVRLYADPESNLVALRSDVPVNPGAATEVAGCLENWFAETVTFPIFLSGRGREKGEAPPSIYGVATGDGGDRLERADVEDPPEAGLISGPTGAMLAEALERDRDAVGLVVESDPQFPDPEAARILIRNGIDPIAETETPTEGLVDQATEIREAKRAFAERMQQATEESSQAEPLKMFQ
ncbi:MULTISPECIES: proteasome assembly chaperone family protein [unclassified Halorubrum]|uniref:proteasome assembly chaperone family protein n=1 Tax=unclassified Halorubrum TaxID=2642239 RepID=UPI000B98A5AF|nr:MULTISPECIES: PAC2 family protein [unclassified Halorubrum]OYR43298.1 3-isopropylmalate dehydratase [Halorubrum sp. Hd13]OYR48308.1 3-isopropylmalate dehydratase [Halorubrum sp. Eb13]OYR50745.1 3-isopropylmalate dehydratase [Halorubrum sp. Ea1]